MAFPHPYGCSQMGDDQEHTRTVLADMIHHPNAGGVLVLGLGCENSNISVLKEYIGEYDEQRVRFLQCQDVEDEHEAGHGDPGGGWPSTPRDLSGSPSTQVSLSSA